MQRTTECGMPSSKLYVYNKIAISTAQGTLGKSRRKDCKSQ